VTPTPLADKSRWGAKLARGELVTSVEIVAAQGRGPAPMLEQCRALKKAGVDAVNVPDGPRAQSRMGVLPSAIMIEREVGIETVLHYCCRDRNLLGMLSDILGAHAAGLRNILIITGDPPKMGPYPEATAVFDIDSIGPQNLVYRLNHGSIGATTPSGAPTRWAVAWREPGSDRLGSRGCRVAWKVDAGAEFAVTQPVFDPRQLEAFLKRVEQFRIPVGGRRVAAREPEHAEYLVRRNSAFRLTSGHTPATTGCGTAPRASRRPRAGVDRTPAASRRTRHPLRPPRKARQLAIQVDRSRVHAHATATWFGAPDGVVPGSSP